MTEAVEPEKEEEEDEEEEEEEGSHLEDQGGERMVILKWISEKWYWGNELD
jgi:hypothetical protein